MTGFIVIISLIGLGFCAAGIFRFYVEYSMYSHGFQTKGEVVRIDRVWVRKKAGPNFYRALELRPILKFKDANGVELRRGFKEYAHASIFEPSEGDIMNVIFYDGNLYAQTPKRIFYGIICSIVGLVIIGMAIALPSY